VSPVRARPARSSPPPRAHRPDRARRAAGPAPVLEATRRSALSVNGCEVGDRFAAERHARRALRRADLRGGGRNRGVRHPCEPDSPRRCCCRSSRCPRAARRGIGRLAGRSTAVCFVVRRAQDRSQRPRERSPGPVRRTHQSPACRPPSREDILYVVKGGSLRSPPAPAAGGRRRPSSRTPPRHPAPLRRFRRRSADSSAGSAASPSASKR
jgi:hypothetical protein